MDISNVVNTKVTELVKYQPHGGTNHLLCGKKTKTPKKMSFLILNYFSKSILLTSTFTCTVDYQKQKNYYSGPLFTYGCINQVVKHWLFWGKYRFKVVTDKGKQLRNQIRMFQNISEKTLRKL